ncbi:hypothetical protein B1H10_01070 [candidate division KSB1 bacterium 4484_188]|nr:MAG: hypothetical protein B1H10_01070 [candidate division KSB1 bacterium 4484_188]HFE63657.1 outer membrane protein assembly factor BamD [Caldithrix sp.]
MKGKLILILLVLDIVFMSIMGCGHKVNRAALDADAYFAYAKKLYDRGKYFEASTEFSIIVLKFSGNPVVDDAQFYLGESHFMNHEYLIAMSEYQKLVDDYPESPYVEEALYKIGLSAYKLSQRPELDQEYTQLALRHFQGFIEAYPKSGLKKEAEKRIFELRSRLAQKQLLGAEVYRKMGVYDSAIIYYDILLEKYYDTPPAEEALFRKGECLMKLKKYDEALTNFSAFISKYPESKYVGDAKDYIGEIQTMVNKDVGDGQEKK